MKVFISVVLCSLALVARITADAPSEATKEVFHKIANECKASTGANDAEIDALIKHEPAASMEGKCLRACVMKALDTMNGSGKFNKAGAMTIAMMVTKGDAAKMKNAEEMIDACVALAVPDDHCEAAEAYGLCMKKEGMARGVKAIQL